MGYQGNDSKEITDIGTQKSWGHVVCVHSHGVVQLPQHVYFQ